MVKIIDTLFGYRINSLEELHALEGKIVEKSLDGKHWNAGVVELIPGEKSFRILRKRRLTSNGNLESNSVHTVDEYEMEGYRMGKPLLLRVPSIFRRKKAERLPTSYR